LGVEPRGENWAFRSECLKQIKDRSFLSDSVLCEKLFSGSNTHTTPAGFFWESILDHSFVKNGFCIRSLVRQREKWGEILTSGLRIATTFLVNDLK
jgi:hypothetical protein